MTLLQLHGFVKSRLSERLTIVGQTSQLGIVGCTRLGAVGCASRAKLKRGRLVESLVATATSPDPVQPAHASATQNSVRVSAYGLALAVKRTHSRETSEQVLLLGRH